MFWVSPALVRSQLNQQRHCPELNPWTPAFESAKKWAELRVNLGLCVYLARSFEKYDLSSTALNFYEDQRRQAVNTIISSNREDGPDKILEIVAGRAPEGFKKIKDIIEIEELQGIAKKYKVTAGFEIDELNKTKAVLDS